MVNKNRWLMIAAGMVFAAACIMLLSLLTDQSKGAAPNMGGSTQTAIVDGTFDAFVAAGVAPEADTITVINRSGNVIGSATLLVYYPDEVLQGSTAVVELELNLLERFITPIPQPTTADFEPIVTNVPSPSPTPSPQMTHRPAQYESEVNEVYQLMGASLHCLTFNGCDDEANPNAARVVGLNGIRWTWFISPDASAHGSQNLRVELWRLIAVNEGASRTDTVWDYTFKIDVPSVSGASSNNNLGMIVIILAVMVISMGVAIWAWNNRPRQKPTVFISYRRKVSWATALKIHDMLTARGADVFMDVQDSREGRYAQKLEEEVRSRNYFVLLIAPGTLESEWVIKEAQMAIDAGKNIIPVLTDGFDLYKNQEEIPTELKDLSSHNAVTLSLEYFEAGIDRLAEFIGLK